MAAPAVVIFGGNRNVDDPPPALSIDDVTGRRRPGTAPRRSRSRSRRERADGTVAFATADGTARAGDYLPAGTLAFAPGETTQTVTVTVNGDALDEADETFFVNLSGRQRDDRRRPGSARSPTTTPPTLSIDDVTVTEGNGGTRAHVHRHACPRPAARR